MTELLDVVDALTKPARTKVIQDVYATVIDSKGHPKVDDNGNPVRELAGTKATRLEHLPLLQQLDDAIRGTMAVTGGDSASMSSTRNLLNSDALYQFIRVRSMITDWARSEGVPRTDDAAAELRAWYVAWEAKPREDSATRFRVRKLNTARTTIIDIIDPKDTRTVPGPCPEPDCPQQERFGLWFYYDPKTREQGNRPLVVEYRPSDGPQMVANARCRCRACGTTWASVRALQYDREQAEKTTEPVEGVLVETPTPE